MERRAEHHQKLAAAAFAAAGVLLLAAALGSCCVGKYPISLEEIWRILTGGAVKDMTRNVFFTLRLSRTAMAVLSGAGLGLAGAVYQIIFKNPLASPDIIGIASGANLGAAVAIVAVSGTMASVAVGAFAGGFWRWRW